MEWTEESFSFFPHCFHQRHFSGQYSSGITICDTLLVNVFGECVLKREREGCEASEHHFLLTEIFEESKKVEVTCMDAKRCDEKDFILLVSCWTEENDVGVVISSFLTLHRIEWHGKSSEAKSLLKEDIDRAVTVCRIVNHSHTSEHGLLLFPVMPGLPSFRQILEMEDQASLGICNDIKEVFPELTTLSSSHGSVIRFSSTVQNGYRWTAVGTDSGCFIAWLVKISDQSVRQICRRAFVSCVSVVLVWSEPGREGEGEASPLFTPSQNPPAHSFSSAESPSSSSVYFLVSSALGPAFILRVRVDDKGEVVFCRQVVLPASLRHDAVTGASRHASSLLIATYSQVLFYYDTSGLSNDFVDMLPALSTYSIRSPVLAVDFIPETSSISALSLAGHHSLRCSRSAKLNVAR